MILLLTLSMYLFVKNKACSLDYCTCLSIKNNKSKIGVELTIVCLSILYPICATKFNVRAKIQISVDKDTVNAC